MRNQLLTKAIERELLAAAPKNHGAPETVKVVAKFFTPDAQCTWFITEGEQDEGSGDWTLFGLCDLGMGCPELGYVSFNELKTLRGGLGLPVERDLHWHGTLADAQREVQS